MSEKTLVSKLFEEAVLLPHKQREQFVIENTKSKKIKNRVLSLLAHYHESEKDEADWPLTHDEISDKDLRPQLTGYKFGRLIRKGGMGEVYAGQQTAFDRKVAIKVIRPLFAKDSIALERFRREASLMAQLKHPNIVVVHDFVEKEGCCYIVMEFVSGPEGGPPMTLEALLNKHGGRLDQRIAKRLILNIADGLKCAHQRNIVHRDIKPANVLIDENNAALITDFGIARGCVGTGRLTQPGAVLGTIGYMSPEQRQGKSDIDHRSDIYSVGILLYRMLVGNLPEHFEKYPSQQRRTLDTKWDNIVFKAIQQDPSERYQSVDEMRNEVDSIILDSIAEPQFPSENPDRSSESGSELETVARANDKFENTAENPALDQNTIRERYGRPDYSKTKGVPVVSSNRWPLVLISVLVISAAGFFLWRSTMIKESEVEKARIALAKELKIPPNISTKVSGLVLQLIPTPNASNAFYTSECEVTNKQWQDIFGSPPPSKFPTTKLQERILDKSDGWSEKMPVENVNFLEACQFCNQLSKIDNLPPYYSFEEAGIHESDGIGYRLPTESELYFVMTEGRYDDFLKTAGSLQDFAWTKENSQSHPHPVGQKNPNAFGIFDSYGNVGEFVSFPGSFCGFHYDVSESDMRQGKGFFNNGLDFSECDLGFRVVRSAK